MDYFLFLHSFELSSTNIFNEWVDFLSQEITLKSAMRIAKLMGSKEDNLVPFHKRYPFLSLFFHVLIPAGRF